MNSNLVFIYEKSVYNLSNNSLYLVSYYVSDNPGKVEILKKGPKEALYSNIFPIADPIPFVKPKCPSGLYLFFFK